MVSFRLQVCSRALLAVLGWGASAGYPLAADFLLDIPTAVTYTLNADDTLTITGLGSITTTANAAHGVNAHAAPDSRIVNNGTITTQGDGANGVFGDDADGISVINNGLIDVLGASASGVLLKLTSPDSSLVNNGVIRVKGDGGAGLSVEESPRTSLVNFGDISVTGQFGDGMITEYSDDSTIINFGTIRSSGESGAGMVIGDSTGGTLANFGTVTTDGDINDALDAWAMTGATMINGGTLRTKGADSYGIAVYDSTGMIVANTGSVISERSYAIMLDNLVFDSELNLSTLGYIGGGIHFEQPLTVNIATGPSHSVLWDLSDGVMSGGAPNVSGSVPWFYNSTTRQFATYDPSILAAEFDELGDVTDMLSDVGGNASGREGLWLAGMGGRRSHAGDGVVTQGRTIQQHGIALGYGGDTDDQTQWSLTGGYLRSNTGIDGDPGASSQSTSDILFATLSGARAFGIVTVDGGVTGGLTARQGSRFINDNLALTNGLTLGEGGADTSSAGLLVAPEIGISAALASTDGWALAPAARLRYAGQWVGSSTETGSAADATIDNLAMGLLEANAELAVSKKLGFGVVSTRLGYQVRHAVGDNAADVTLLGTTKSISFAPGDSQTAYVGLDLALEPTPNVRLTFDAMGYFGYELTGGRASADLKAAF